VHIVGGSISVVPHENRVVIAAMANKIVRFFILVFVKCI
jgi:hypothetical protein